MYKTKVPKELRELVDKHKMLTFESQIQLRDELKIRGLEIPIDGLITTINDKVSSIKNFDYLPELGFRLEEDENSFRVKRTTKAILTDLFAILLGLLLFARGLYGMVDLVASLASGEEIGYSTIITGIINTAMIIIGIKFLSGVQRFFYFLGFELSKTNGNIVLKKRFDLKIEEFKIEKAYLNLEQYKDKLILKLDDKDILNSNAKDMIQKMTIESLYQKLRS